MVCGLPSSVTTKSLAVRPSMTLPSLSLTLTISSTNWDRLENLTGSPAAAGGFCVAGAGRGGWACGAPAASIETSKTMTVGRISSGPQSHIGSDYAHRIGAAGQPELRAQDIGIPTGKSNVVEQVTRIKPHVDAVAIPDGEGAAHRTIQ